MSSFSTGGRRRREQVYPPVSPVVL